MDARGIGVPHEVAGNAGGRQCKDRCCDETPTFFAVLNDFCKIGKNFFYCLGQPMFTGYYYCAMALHGAKGRNCRQYQPTSLNQISKARDT